MKAASEEQGRPRASARTGAPRPWRRVAAVAWIIVGLNVPPAAAHACVGDCKGQNVVDITDLIVGVNIVLGTAPVSDCPAFANASGVVDISQLITGVNNALNGCDQTGAVAMLTGSCAVPGNGRRGLRTCDAGTPITVFRCDDRSQCLHEQGLTMVGATTVGSDGTWAVRVNLADVSAALVFQASITKAVVYRTLGFGTVGNSARAAVASEVAASDVTFPPIAITPVTEAGVQLLDTNGLQNYTDTGAQEVLSAVRQATANISFDGLSPDAGVALALSTANADPNVTAVLQEARGGPTVTAGLQALTGGDVHTAAAVFAGVLAADPSNGTARFYATLSQSAARLIDSAALRALAQRGVGSVTGDSSDLCALAIPSASALLPSAPATGELRDAFVQLVNPEIQSVLTDLARIAPNTSIQVPLTALPACIRPRTNVAEINVDLGDLLSVRAALEFVLAAVDLVGGYNVESPLYTLANETPLSILTFQPQLLTLTTAASLQSAEQHLNAALGLSIQAIDAILARTGDQSGALLVIETTDVPTAQRLRFLAGMIQQALSGEVSIPIDTTTGQVDLTGAGSGPRERLNLSPLFMGQIANLRQLLPGFNKSGGFDEHRLADPTFAGMAPDLTQGKIDNFLAGGPSCAVCTADADCNNAYGFGRFHCGECGFACSSQLLRCVNGFNGTQCSDGFYF